MLSWLERHPMHSGLWIETLHSWEQPLGHSLPRGGVWDVHLSFPPTAPRWELSQGQACTGPLTSAWWGGRFSPASR